MAKGMDREGEKKRDAETEWRTGLAGTLEGIMEGEDKRKGCWTETGSG